MPISREGFTYTRYLFKPIVGGATGGCHADVFLPKDVRTPAPVAICFHGGGFTICDAQHIFCGHVGYLREQGFAVVSLEYSVRFTEIREDVLDGYRWVLDVLPSLAPIDPEQRFIFGGSAGASSLLLLCADALAEGVPLPCANYVAFPLTDLTRMEQEMEYAVALKTLSPEDCGKVDALLDEGVATGHDFLTEDLDAPSGRMMMQTGALFEHLTGSAAPFSVQHSPLHNLQPGFPPTVFVLADADTDVSPAHTLDAADRLAALGVETQVILGEGMPHAGLAPQRGGGDAWKRWWESVSVPALDFCIAKALAT